MNPYGSVFVRAETGRYGESIDCLEGTSTSPTRRSRSRTSGRLSPTVRISTPVAGRPAAGDHDGPGRLAGPLLDRAPPAAPFAVVPAVVVAPAPPAAAPAPAPARPPQAKAAVRSTKLAVKQSKIALSVGCEGSATTCTGTVSVKASAKVKVGKTRKVVTLTKAVKYTVAGGSNKTVKLALTSQAKALLKKTKKLSVTITIKPASGADRDAEGDAEAREPYTLDEGRGHDGRGPRGVVGGGRRPPGRRHQPQLLPVQLRQLLARHGRHARRDAERRGRDHHGRQPVRRRGPSGMAGAVRLQLRPPAVGAQRAAGQGVARGARHQHDAGRPDAGDRHDRRDDDHDRERSVRVGDADRYSIPALGSQQWTRPRRAGGFRQAGSSSLPPLPVGPGGRLQQPKGSLYILADARRGDVRARLRARQLHRPGRGARRGDGASFAGVDAPSFSCLSALPRSARLEMAGERRLAGAYAGRSTRTRRTSRTA